MRARTRPLSAGLKALSTLYQRSTKAGALGYETCACVHHSLGAGAQVFHELAPDARHVLPPDCRPLALVAHQILLF
jgi:hypothetical protein